MKKQIFIVLLFFWALPSGFAQLKTLTFEEAERIALQNPKPIVVFIHTNWCNYCKMMENSTFKNKEVIHLLNEGFYFISFDAESKKPINFNDQIFIHKPTGPNSGIHELATALATIDNQLSYPTIVILDDEKRILFQKQSYLSAKELQSILEKTQELAIFEKK